MKRWEAEGRGSFEKVTEQTKQESSDNGNVLQAGGSVNKTDEDHMKYGYVCAWCVCVNVCAVVYVVQRLNTVE